MTALTTTDIHFGYLLLGIVLGACGVGVMWLVSSERLIAANRALRKMVLAAQSKTLSVLKDNVKLAEQVDDLTARLSMALDAELLSSPNTVVEFPTQRLGSDDFGRQVIGLDGAE